MPVHNAEIARIFDRVADLLEIEGANAFRVRAYHNAARTLGELSRDVSEMVAGGEDLTELPGIGKDLAAKIREIASTGRISLLEAIERRTPQTLADLMKIPGMGPRRIHVLHDELGIVGIGELEKAAQEGKLRRLPGFGERTERRILSEIRRMGRRRERIRLNVAEEIARPLAEYLRGIPGVEELAVAGSLRRRVETVGDLDFVVTCRDPAIVVDRFVEYEDMTSVILQGDTRSSIRLRSGIQADLRVVPHESFGAAMHYFTGSKAHDLAVRRLAHKRGLKVNEYGVFDPDGERVAGRTEKEVFRAVGLPYIEPELREGRGEVEAALAGALPRLVTPADIRGDLHVHTNATDGRHSIEEMAWAARERGYEYIAITDHSRRLAVARGLDVRRLREQGERIDRLNEPSRSPRILKGIEVDILPDGSLDLPDAALAGLDICIGSIHSRFDLSRQKQTERILRAMDNRRLNILGHPTGRLIGSREPYDVDVGRILEGAKERGVFLEINAHPERLDLNDVSAKAARDRGVKVAVSTDAHRITDLYYMRFGVGQARRGWMEAGDVLNTRPWEELRKLLER